MINWDQIAKDFKAVLGYDALKIDPSGVQAMVVSDNTPIAILKAGEQDSINVHLRASILPNTAGLIGSVISHSHAMYLGENFEFLEDGSWVFGQDALKFFADNAKVLLGHADKLSDAAPRPALDLKSLN